MECLTFVYRVIFWIVGLIVTVYGVRLCVISPSPFYFASPPPLPLTPLSPPPYSFSYFLLSTFAEIVSSFLISREQNMHAVCCCLKVTEIVFQIPSLVVHAGICYPRIFTARDEWKSYWQILTFIKGATLAWEWIAGLAPEALEQMGNYKVSTSRRAAYMKNTDRRQRELQHRGTAEYIRDGQGKGSYETDVPCLKCCVAGTPLSSYKSHILYRDSWKHHVQLESEYEKNCRKCM